jgi:hypothetical protein
MVFLPKSCVVDAAAIFPDQQPSDGLKISEGKFSVAQVFGRFILRFSQKTIPALLLYFPHGGCKYRTQERGLFSIGRHRCRIVFGLYVIIATIQDERNIDMWQ